MKKCLLESANCSYLDQLFLGFAKKRHLSHFSASHSPLLFKLLQPLEVVLSQVYYYTMLWHSATCVSWQCLFLCLSECSQQLCCAPSSILLPGLEQHLSPHQLHTALRLIILDCQYTAPIGTDTGVLPPRFMFNRGHCCALHNSCKHESNLFRWTRLQTSVRLRTYWAQLAHNL